jgi:hypothetical protein
MGMKIAWGVGALALGAACLAFAQTPAGFRAPGMLVSGGLAWDEAQNTAQEDVVREIDDPHTGDRWLLVRNDQTPGGPGRLVLVAAHRSASGSAAHPLAGQPGEAQIFPVIRAGDTLIVEEHTARVDAVLEARALNLALAGSMLDVRLKMGGNVVRAIAVGPGRAALQPIAGARR